MKLYDVEGHEYPLMLSEEHAEIIGAIEHVVESEKPAQRASKADWASYALGQGADPELVDGMTRAELIENWG